MSKKNNKLPKRVAGVKLPKGLRKGAVSDFIGSPTGKAIIAEAVLALGAALVGHQARSGSATRRAAGKTGKALKATGDTSALAASDAVQGAGAVSDRLTNAFSAATQAFRDALQERPAAKPAAAATPAPKKAKPTAPTVRKASTLAH